MTYEASPEFSSRFPEAAAIFDNLHMLHDNVDDVLSRPDLYPTLETKRDAILKILTIYLHRNHEPEGRYAEYHEAAKSGGHEKHGTMEQGEKHGGGMMQMTGPRPPSAREVLFGKASDKVSEQQDDKEKPSNPSKHEHNHGQY